MEEVGGDQGEKRKEGQGTRREGREIKKRNVPRSTPPTEDPGLRRETSEEGQTHSSASPGEAEQTAAFSQRGRKPSMAHLGVLPGQGLAGRGQRS